MSSSGIITGVGQGIGFETCNYFLNNGYTVYGVSKSSNKNINYLKSKHPKKFIFLKIDINNVSKMKKKTKEIFKSDKKVKFLINNAGTRSRFPLKNLRDEEIQRVFKTNFFSHLKLTQEFLKNTINRKIKNVSIVMLSSIVGNLGFEDLSNYASSKGAIESFAKSVAVEYSKYNVRVNCVAPGFIKTSYFEKFKNKRKKLYNWTISRIPLKRWGESSEVSPLIEFLISKKSSYITGSTFFVDGGWSIS